MKFKMLVLCLSLILPSCKRQHSREFAGGGTEAAPAAGDELGATGEVPIDPATISKIIVINQAPEKKLGLTEEQSAAEGSSNLTTGLEVGGGILVTALAVFGAYKLKGHMSKTKKDMAAVKAELGAAKGRLDVNEAAIAKNADEIAAQREIITDQEEKIRELTTKLDEAAEKAEAGVKLAEKAQDLARRANVRDVAGPILTSSKNLAAHTNALKKAYTKLDRDIRIGSDKVKAFNDADKLAKAEEGKLVALDSKITDSGKEVEKLRTEASSDSSKTPAFDSANSALEQLKATQILTKKAAEDLRAAANQAKKDAEELLPVLSADGKSIKWGNRTIDNLEILSATPGKTREEVLKTKLPQANEVNVVVSNERLAQDKVTGEVTSISSVRRLDEKTAAQRFTLLKGKDEYLCESIITTDSGKEIVITTIKLKPKS